MDVLAMPFTTATITTTALAARAITATTMVSSCTTQLAYRADHTAGSVLALAEACLCQQ